MDVKCRPSLVLLLVSLWAMSLVSPVRLWAFTWLDDRLVASPLHGSIRPDPQQTWADLNGDGQEEEVTFLAGAAAIRTAQTILWSSPPNWDIQRVHVADLNRDGDLELALLVWRDFVPWPIDAWLAYPGRIDEFHDQQGRSCHVILIGWQDVAFRELWAGSALSRPLLDFMVSDVNEDGHQELIALESSYDAPAGSASAVTVWEWNGFGFTLLSRSPKGKLRTLISAHTQQGIPLVLLQGTLRR